MITNETPTPFTVHSAIEQGSQRHIAEAPDRESRRGVKIAGFLVIAIAGGIAIGEACKPVRHPLPAHAAIPTCQPCSWSPGDCGGRVSLCEQKPDGRLCCNKANP